MKLTSTRSVATPAARPVALSIGLLVLLLAVPAFAQDDYEGDGPGECTDRADNDRDGKFDCDDDGCKGSPDCNSRSPRGTAEPSERAQLSGDSRQPDEVTWEDLQRLEELLQVTDCARGRLDAEVKDSGVKCAPLNAWSGQRSFCDGEIWVFGETPRVNVFLRKPGESDKHRVGTSRNPAMKDDVQINTTAEGAYMRCQGQTWSQWPATIRWWEMDYVRVVASVEGAYENPFWCVAVADQKCAAIVSNPHPNRTDAVAMRARDKMRAVVGEGGGGARKVAHEIAGLLKRILAAKKE